MLRRCLPKLLDTLATTCRLMNPDDANFYGTIHGGTTLQMIEQAGFIAASRYCNQTDSKPVAASSHAPILPVVAHVSDVQFLEPVYTGELMSIKAKPVFTSKHSVEVLVEVWADHVVRRKLRKTNTALLTYVGTDPNIYTKKRDSKESFLREVPKLQPKTAEEEKLYQEGEARYQARKGNIYCCAPTPAPSLDVIVPDLGITSRTLTLVELTQPKHCWFGDHVSGGSILRFMDDCGGVASTHHCHSGTVTVQVDALDFKHPVRLGDVVHIHATPVYTSNKSIQINIQVEVEQIGVGIRTRVTCGSFYLVGMGADGKAIPIPQLKPETELEKQVFEIARRTADVRKANRMHQK